MTLQYYLWSSYRRKLLDRLQEKHRALFSGVVLDIGGRDRGKFKKPKRQAKRWIFIDIVPEHKPDIVADVTNMKKQIKSASADTVCAMELFEHVSHPEAGLRECCRVLKKEGKLVMSVPFLFPIHADPYDFQRWTDQKWKQELRTAGFTKIKITVMGCFFTVMGDSYKRLIRGAPFGLRHLLYLGLPFCDLLVSLDRTKWMKRNSILNKFHAGYFIIAQK